MDHCPTCKAKYSGKTICHRCKTDLSALINIENKATEHLEHAISAFHSNNFPQMFFHAKRACSLRRTPQSEKILECAALLVGQYELAISRYLKKKSVERLCTPSKVL